MMNRAFLPFLLLAASGCFAVTDLDRFSKSTGGGSTQFDDLKVTVRAMTSHVNELTEFRVIDANNVIQFRGIIQPLGGPEATFDAPLAIPKVNGPFRLDFYADHDNTLNYSGFDDPKDHAWRIEPLQDFPPGSGNPNDGVVEVVFDHNRSFSDLDQFPKGRVAPPTDTGVNATIKLTNMTAHVGKLVQARVKDAGTGHTAGLFRTKPGQAAVDLVIAGIVDAGVEYDVEIWIDANGNGVYDNPARGGGDLGWKIRRPSDRASGMRLDFDPGSAALGDSKVDVGAP